MFKNVSALAALITLGLVFALSPAYHGSEEPSFVPFGKAPPPFPVPTSWEGTAPLTLKNLRGKAVLIYIFVPEIKCGSCDATILHLQRLNLRYGKRLQILATAKTTPDVLKRYAEKWRGKIPMMQDPGGSYIRSLMGKLTMYPYVALLDTDGRLAWMGRDEPHSEISARVAHLLKPEKEKAGSRYRVFRRLGVSIGLAADPLTEAKLPTALDDARLMARYMRKTSFTTSALMIDNGKADTPLYPSVKHITNYLELMNRQARAGDDLIVYYSGQLLSFKGPSGKKELALLGADKENLGLVRLSEVARLLVKPGVRHLLIADIAHDKATGTALEKEIRTFRAQFPDLNALFSCNPGARSHRLDKARHSLFASYLQSGLSGAADRNGNAWLETSELYRYIQMQLHDWGRKSGTFQVPILLHSETAAPALPMANIQLP